MIILRQKEYTDVVSRVQAKEAISKVGKKSVPDLHILPLRTRAKIERTKRNIIKGTVDTINNPVGAVADLGRDVISRPLNTAGKVAIAVPFPASVPVGFGAIKVGDEINKRVKPLGKLSEGIRKRYENTKAYKKIKGINLRLVPEYNTRKPQVR